MLLFVGVFHAEAAASVNFCGLTLNSSTEIDLFRSQYKNANFIELTDFVSPTPGAPATTARQWLKRACRAGIKCDVLVVSGHFAGEFFGRSQITVTLEDLEELSCMKECDGIFKQPKEVMLLGCNTLAGKGTERESITSYIQRLQEHYSEQFMHPSQIERVAAFRYLPFGMTYADRMRSIFDRSVKVYGFDSVAPTGPQISPSFSEYLRQVGPDYGKHLSSLKAGQPNTKLATVLKNSTYIEYDKASRGRAPVCMMKDDKLTPAARLEWIEKALLSEDWIAFSPAISRYFKEVVDINSAQVLSPETSKIFQRIRTNKKIYQRVVDTMKDPNFQKLVSVKFELVHLLEALGFDAENLMQNYRRMILAELPTKADQIAMSKEDVCTPAYSPLARAALKLEDLKGLHEFFRKNPKPKGQAGQESETWFTKVVSCLAPTSPSIVAYVATELEKELKAKKDVNESVFGPILTAISEHASVPGENLERMMAISQDARVYMIENVIARQKFLDYQSSQLVLKSLKNQSTRVLTLTALGSSKPDDLAIQRYLLDMHADKSLNTEVREELRKVMAAIEPQRAEIQAELLKIYLKSGDSVVDPKAFKRAAKPTLDTLEKILKEKNSPSLHRVLALLIVAQPQHTALKDFVLKNIDTNDKTQRALVTKILAEALSQRFDQQVHDTVVKNWRSGRRVPGMVTYMLQRSRQEIALLVDVLDAWKSFSARDPIYAEIQKIVESRLVWRQELLKTVFKLVNASREDIQLYLIEYIRMADIPEDNRKFVVAELERISKTKQSKVVKAAITEILPVLRVDAGLSK